MFGEYDVRGRMGEEITENNFFLLGKALNRIGYKELVIGRDYRKNSLELAEALAEGFGDDVLNIGVVPTPVVAFFSENGGVQITASHNPPEYNGAKIFKKRTLIGKNEMDKIRKEFEKIKKEKQNTKKRNVFKENNEIVKNYLEKLPEIENGIFDLGGGAACSIKEIFPKTIFATPDSEFAHHSPEPKEGTLNKLEEIAKKEKEVGWAFDGDADRAVAVVDGKVIRGDILGAFFAANELKDGSRIVVSVDCSEEVIDYLKRRFTIFYSKIGTPNITKKSFEKNAAFSMEFSGHYTYYRWLPYSDPIFISAKLSKYGAKEFGAFVKKFKNTMVYYTIPTRINIKKIKEKLEKKGFEISTLDGIKATKEDVSTLVRHSNTQPITRIQIEGKNKNELMSLKKLLDKY